MSTPDRDLEPAEALRAELEAEREAGQATDDAVDADEVDDEVLDLDALAANGELDADADIDDEVDGDPELAIALSPRQILGGFALLAAIVVWLLRRGRKK